MIDVRRAGPSDAAGLMVLRAEMLGSITGTPPPAGEWQRAGAEMLRARLDPASRTSDRVEEIDRPKAEHVARLRRVRGGQARRTAAMRRRTS